MELQSIILIRIHLPPLTLGRPTVSHVARPGTQHRGIVTYKSPVEELATGIKMEFNDQHFVKN